MPVKFPAESSLSPDLPSIPDHSHVQQLQVPAKSAEETMVTSMEAGVASTWNHIKERQN